jgi:hypothetical protein
MSKKRAILVHGWGGSPEEGWRPWLKKEFTKKGWEKVIDFTKIKKGGVGVKELLSRLQFFRKF